MKMMIEIGFFLPAFVTGILLGVIFFGGLWWTVKKGLGSKHAALWFIGSLFIRTTLTVGGFYLISAGSWQKLLTCLGGFLLVRLLMTRSKRFSVAHSPAINKENSHAPES